MDRRGKVEETVGWVASAVVPWALFMLAWHEGNGHVAPFRLLLNELDRLNARILSNLESTRAAVG